MAAYLKQTRVQRGFFKAREIETGNKKEKQREKIRVKKSLAEYQEFSMEKNEYSFSLRSKEMTTDVHNRKYLGISASEFNYVNRN